MGFADRRPVLPAPTDSLLESTDDPGLGTDVGTNISQRSDRTSQTIPDDGSPITITTGHKRSAAGKLAKSGNPSQTSLLIEYFEGSKGSESSSPRRPSLRVRVTPSRAQKSKDGSEGHIVVTEAQTTRRPSQSHRIALGTTAPGHGGPEGSARSPASAEPGARGAAQYEIEVSPKDDSEVSAISASPEARCIIPESDISSMPPDSMVGNTQPGSASLPPAPSDSVSRGGIDEPVGLKAPHLSGGHNLSNERITQKVIEKLSNKRRVSSGSKRHHRSQSGTRTGVSREGEVPTTGGESGRRSSKHVEDEPLPSATASSLGNASLLSADPKSVDQRSVRSGASNVSINNPKLLQAVEDTIRRLILPELKELKKEQRHGSHRPKYDKHSAPSDLSSTSSVSREEITRRKSSGGTSRHRVSRGSDAGRSVDSPRRERYHKSVDYDSPSEQSYHHTESVDSVSISDDRPRRKHRKGHRVQDPAAIDVAAGAALTAAALHDHDSDQSARRRKRRSKSRSSHSASIAEEDIFQKHHVPPMPFVSEIETDLTRSSLLSSHTAGTETPTRREVREVVRGSPRGLSSPASQTPTRTPVDLRRGLGTHHGNFSEHDLSGLQEGMEEQGEDEQEEQYDFATHGFAALTDPERARAYEQNLHHQHPIRRGLSPIQSVASYATTEHNRNSIMQTRSSESLGSVKKEQHPLEDQVSVSSLSSAPSTDVARSKRPKGINLERRSEIMDPHEGARNTRSGDMDPDSVFDEQHLENERYRESYASSGPRIPSQHMSTYTDDSTDVPYLDKVAAGQQIARVVGATAEYVHTPPAVESAIASLYDPSVLESLDSQSPGSSQVGSVVGPESRRSRSAPREFESRTSGSPLKQQLSRDSQERIVEPGEGGGVSGLARDVQAPEQFSEPSVKPAVPQTLDAARQDATTDASPESDITTNPSVIQGPIGGLSQGNREHWPYDPTPPRSRADLMLPPASRDLGSAGADLVPEALTINHDHDLDAKRGDTYMNIPNIPSPPGAKDEGYETGANVRSPGLYPEENQDLPPERFTPDSRLEDPFTLKDAFMPKTRDQYVSGLSQGLSPLYDSATGRGIDRIQSKDIVALMDHLTVRDAQRNARDTEILVTLVRSAAEMRNSFEEMKRFIGEQHDILMDTTDKQHERTQKIIGGPRPPPTAPARLVRSTGVEDEDQPAVAKRRNVLRRVLRGLGSKNAQELQNIEAMLVQLLGDVEALRTLHSATGTNERGGSTSLNSADNARAPTDTGYEPEGQAGTSSTGDRSGFFSNNSSRQADYRGLGARRDTGNRVSTVMEGDEEYEDHHHHNNNNSSNNNGLDPRGFDQGPDDGRTLQATPRADDYHHVRGGSVPLNTPPRMHDQTVGSLSNENTPHLSAGETSSRKHKSFASSFIPKMVSRWSKTTASSAGENLRQSTQARTTRPYSQVSRSGSNLGEYEYDPQGDDRLRSDTSFPDEQYRDQENRPPSPLVPSQVSDYPKYQAHRNSVNLQHPQPRQGPTGRFQHRLESEAQNYSHDQISPTSQTSSQWDNQPSLNNTAAVGAPTAPYGHGGRLSPISDADYSERSASYNHGGQHDVRSNLSAGSLTKQGPPRPPKILDDEPLVPQRPPKIPMSPSTSRQPTYVDHVAAARAGSPAFDKSPVAALRSSPGQTRKPSGPRPLAGSSPYGKGSPGDPGAIKRTRFRGSPNQIDSDDEMVAY